MATELSAKIGDMEYDGLVAGTVPQIQVAGGVVAAGSAEATLARGTILGKNSSGKLAVLGSADGLTADSILCDDLALGTSSDETVPVYTAGCFDLNKVIVADDYTITDTDKDNLRMRGIVFKAASAAV